MPSARQAQALHTRYCAFVPNDTGFALLIFIFYAYIYQTLKQLSIVKPYLSNDTTNRKNDMSKITSIKKVIKNQTKLTDLQIQILELQEKEKALQNEISLKFSFLLQATDALIIPHDILVGGILNIVTSYKNNTQEIGEWQQAGSTFLEKKKPSKSTKVPQPQPQKAASNTNHD